MPAGQAKNGQALNVPADRDARKPRRGARTLVALSLVAILSGCETAADLDVFGFFDEEPAVADAPGQASVRDRGDQENAAASNQPTPNLSSVPERPEAATTPDVRARVVEGLAADRENARYSDEAIRLQGSTRETTSAPATTTTTAPPPPPIRVTADRGPETSVPAAPTQTARAAPPAPVAPVAEPAPVPTITGSTPGVQVDITAIDGGTGYSAAVSAATLDEQVATIHFAHSSSRLDERDRQVLAEVASVQKQNNVDIIVVGHASGRTQQLDKVEHELANFRISLARANRVAEELIAMGVAREKVSVEAAADGKPQFSESMPTGEAGNRRADIFFRQ